MLGYLSRSQCRLFQGSSRLIRVTREELRGLLAQWMFRELDLSPGAFSRNILNNPNNPNNPRSAGSENEYYDEDELGAMVKRVVKVLKVV